MPRLTLDEWTAFSDGVSERALRQILGVHRTTLKRWRAGRTRIPHAARELARIHFQGALSPMAGAQWAGWRFGHDGLLYAPTLKRGFSPSDLYALSWLAQSESWRQARARRTETA